MSMSILSVPLIATAVILLFCFYIKLLRYGSSRDIILNLFCHLQGRRPLWVRDPDLAQRLLHSSTSKGQGIEQLISYHAFHPALSLESVEGDEWVRMKRHFLLLRAQLPPLQDLTTVTAKICQEYLVRYELIDSECLERIVLVSMVKWIFDIDEVDQDLDFVLEAMKEWRMELAIKDEADMKIKLKAVDWIKKLIRDSKYEPLFGEKWEQPEYWSLILQPFFISPIINLTDIAVTIDTEGFQRDHVQNSTWNEHLFVKAINLNHPFPVLERWFPEGLTDSLEKTQLVPPNTHVFLPMEDIGRRLVQGRSYTGNTSWVAFGAGKRACAGRDVAFALSNQIFQVLIGHPKFKPSQGHVYSGRDNDSKETMAESWFQIRLLLRIIWRLLKKRLGFKTQPLTSSSYVQIMKTKNQKCTSSSLLF